jgi:chromosome partitioning protein
MREFFGDLVFDTVIHRSIRLAEAPSAGESVLTYAPDSRGAIEYLALVDEILYGKAHIRATKEQTPEADAETAVAAAVGDASATQSNDAVDSSQQPQGETAVEPAGPEPVQQTANIENSEKQSGETDGSVPTGEVNNA